MNPKVFISHASEDKQRFVLNFARKLYEKGVEAWVDEWEMLPGDSLVDRIWDEGIGQAQAMIVVLSEYSVNKPWVKAELNTGVVRRIQGHSRLIPIIIGNIDDSQMPESLRDTLWIRITVDPYRPAQLDRLDLAGCQNLKCLILREPEQPSHLCRSHTLIVLFFLHDALLRVVVYNWYFLSLRGP